MLLVLCNTPISKYCCLCLNPCLDIPSKSKFYVKNLVTKHNKDLSSKSPIYRKIGAMFFLPLSYGHFYVDYAIFKEIDKKKSPQKKLIIG